MDLKLKLSAVGTGKAGAVICLASLGDMRKDKRVS